MAIGYRKFRGVITLAVEGALTTGAGKKHVRMPFAGTITGVTTAVGTAPTGAALIVDVNKKVGAGAATTIFTTQANRPTIAAAAFSATAGTHAVRTFAAGDVLSIDIDQIGSSVAGSDLVVAIAYDGVRNPS